jgi:hypothetical protein
LRGREKGTGEGRQEEDANESEDGTDKVGVDLVVLMVVERSRGHDETAKMWIREESKRKSGMWFEGREGKRQARGSARIRGRIFFLVLNAGTPSRMSLGCRLGS